MNELVDTFANRLNTAIHIRNIKPIELSEKTGIDKSKISSYMSGRYKAKQDGVFLLARALNVNEAWLMGLDVPMERNFREEQSNAFPTSDTPIMVPVVGKIAAGLPILAVENIERYEFAPSSYIKKDYQYFYLRVQGDSMNLKFPDGDLVLVQKQDSLENNEIGVILVNGYDATVKKYRNENGLVILEPMSSNPEHTTQVYNSKKVEIKIIGKVILHIGVV